MNLREGERERENLDRTPIPSSNFNQVITRHNQLILLAIVGREPTVGRGDVLLLVVVGRT